MTAVFEQLSSPRILRGTRADIWVDAYLAGDRTAPTSAGTVTVTNQFGDTVASGAATIDTTAKRLSFTLTAAETADSALLTASWADVVMGSDPEMTITSQHEIVGAHLFTLNEMRGFDPALANQTKYPDNLILDCRDQIHDAFESVLGYSIGGRIATTELRGGGYEDIWLPYGTAVIRKVETRESSTWTAFDSDELADTVVEASGRLYRESGEGWTCNQRVRVTYESGPIPPELKRAALQLAKQQLVNNSADLPARALSQTDERGTFSLATPGMRGSEFGLPEVDAVLKRRAANLPRFA